MEKFIVVKHGLYESRELCKYGDDMIMERSDNVYAWDYRANFKTRDEAQVYADKFNAQVESR